MHVWVLWLLCEAPAAWAVPGKDGRGEGRSRGTEPTPTRETPQHTPHITQQQHNTPHNKIKLDTNSVWPNSVWPNSAMTELMMIKFGESGHPVF